MRRGSAGGSKEARARKRRVDGLVLEEFAEPGLFDEPDNKERDERREEMVEARLRPIQKRGLGGLRHGDYLRKKESRGKL